MIRRALQAVSAAEHRVRYLPHRVHTTSGRAYRRALDSASVVSIDVFDTAIFRCVPEPADVFEIAALRLREAGALALTPAEFRQARVTAELDARRVAACYGREEVTLTEIYAALGARLTGLDIERAQAEELNVERAVCVANPDLRRLYDGLRRNGRRVAFTSDTYLSESFVAALLRACGYAGDHELFVSNAHRATKEHGTLYRLMSDGLGVAPAGIVHLGDKLRPDLRSAMQAGVKAFWYVRRLRESPFDGEGIGNKVLARLAALAADEPGRREERLLRAISYAVMGPIFLGLSQWLIERVRSEPTDLVLFCARDGYLLHQLYMRFAQHVSLPPARYFEVSRRALVFPSIRELDERALEMLCGNHAPLRLPEFFSRIGLDASSHPAEIAAAGLENARIHDRESRRRLRDLFVVLRETILERARSERALMLAYLAQNGLFEANALAVVDIGWGGTLQEALAGVLASEGRRPAIRGYYLSTDERIGALGPEAGPATGWFANGGRPVWMQADITLGHWLLEIAFAAPHGTVLGYRRETGGRVGAVRQECDPDSTNARAAVAIHAASADFADRWIRIFGGLGPPVSAEAAFTKFQRFLKNPSFAEARFFGDMVHIGGFGATTETSPIAAPPRLRDFVRRPSALFKAYHESRWQLAFVQRIIGSKTAARGILALRELVRSAAGALSRRSTAQ